MNLRDARTAADFFEAVCIDYRERHQAVGDTADDLDDEAVLDRALLEFTLVVRFSPFSRPAHFVEHLKLPLVHALRGRAADHWQVHFRGRRSEWHRFGYVLGSALFAPTSSPCPWGHHPDEASLDMPRAVGPGDVLTYVHVLKLPLSCPPAAGG